MLILKKGHQPGVYVPLRALFLVSSMFNCFSLFFLFNTKFSFLHDLLRVESVECYLEMG